MVCGCVSVSERGIKAESTSSCPDRLDAKKEREREDKRTARKADKRMKQSVQRGFYGQGGFGAGDAVADSFVSKCMEFKSGHGERRLGQEFAVLLNVMLISSSSSDFFWKQEIWTAGMSESWSLDLRPVSQKHTTREWPASVSANERTTVTIVCKE